MRDALILLLIVAVVALGVMIHRQSGALSDQQKQIKELSSKLESNGKQGSLDLQQQCAIQSRKEFNDDGWNDKKHPLAGFVNHYKAKLGRCFMSVEDTSQPNKSDPTFLTNKFISDAFEGRSYADYAWKSEKGKKYWEVRPFVCKVTLPSGEKKDCASSDEFDELVKVYMEP